jgi:adenylate cyclase
MAELYSLPPWLELATGEQWPISHSCSIGRSLSNSVVLAAGKVSRRHAIIHNQNDEFWLVDLGSSNGTYLNGRRVAQPTQLQNRDQIVIGDFVVTFRHSKEQSTRNQTVTDATLQDVKIIKCWLLVADMIGSTQLTQQLPAEELSMMTGRWLAACKEIVDRHGGGINKFLGDGFFAYWPKAENKGDAIVAALTELKELQARANPAFRVVLHHGEVTVGGMATLGEDSLMGSDVNFVFRLEELAGTLRKPCLMSSSARLLVPLQLVTTEVGQHAWPGLSQPEPFYAF